MNPRLTALIAASLLPVLGLFDGFLAIAGGNRATFSWGQLVTRAKDPAIALAVASTFGIALTHFYNPSPATQAPSPIGILCRCIIVLSLTVSAIVYIASGPAADPSVVIDPEIATPKNRFLFAGAMLLAVAVGMVLGLAVPQHPFAEDS